MAAARELGRLTVAGFQVEKKRADRGTYSKDAHPETVLYVERSNLTMRMHMRRFTRLTNAFSKKVENHAAAIARHTMYYNFVRIHQTLRVTPAMAAGVTKKLWEVSDIVAMLEQWELANFKPEYNFVVRQYAIGKGHSVSVLWRGGEVDTIFGFEKEADGWRGLRRSRRDGRLSKTELRN
jgi:hypothetical protein